jgi:hypothetical protein
VAARRQLIGLSLWGSRNPAPGYLLGAVLTAGGFVWFLTTTPGIFSPGLAGSELAVLFGAAGICALALTLIASSALHGFQHRGAFTLAFQFWNSADNRFMDQSVSALFLPHTDTASFPSVMKLLER